MECREAKTRLCSIKGRQTMLRLFLIYSVESSAEYGLFCAIRITWLGKLGYRLDQLRKVKQIFPRISVWVRLKYFMWLILRGTAIVRRLLLILMRNIPSKFGRLPIYIAVESSVLICNIPSGIRKVSDQYKSINASAAVDFANTTALFLYFLLAAQASVNLPESM